MPRIPAFSAVVLLVLLAAAPPASALTIKDQEACWASPTVIKVIVKNVRSSQGIITADLHNDRPEQFLKSRYKILRVRVPARKGKTELCVPAPGPGVFAIALYHDVNANTDLDKNGLGIPTEPFGISNNPTIFLGPPSHEEAAFEVKPEGATLEIELKD